MAETNLTYYRYIVPSEAWYRLSSGTDITEAVQGTIVSINYFKDLPSAIILAKTEDLSEIFKNTHTQYDFTKQPVQQNRIAPDD